MCISVGKLNDNLCVCVCVCALMILLLCYWLVYRYDTCYGKWVCMDDI